MAAKKSQQKALPAPQQAPIRALVKVYEVVLTFDTNKPNEQIEEETTLLIEKINELLAKHIKDSLPQIFKDKQKKTKIAIVPIKPEDLED
jgi:hypothetical protein